MKPILYKHDETDFGHNGIGILVDTKEATVTEERNGMFELEFVYPVNGLHFDLIEEDCIVKAKANETLDDQLFRIYKSDKPLDGLVTFYAHHISYDLRYNPLPKISVSGPGQVMLNEILTKAINPHPFSGYSDVTRQASTEIGPVNAREALGGKEGSLLHRWHGEFEFDNFVIRHLQNRGQDTGVLISYGKNLTDFKQEKELDSVFTSVYPYAKITVDDEEQVITLPKKIISLESEQHYPVKRTMMLDLTGDQSIVDEESLRAAADSYLSSNSIDKPKVNWTISFINLWQTEEYKDIALLERVNLCDYVTVRFVKYNVDVKAQVIRTVYNVLTEKYDEIELGNAKSDFVNEFNNQRKEVQKQIEGQQSFLQAAINRATDAITGTSGGYIRLNPKENPQELLIMDKPTIEEATKVWRWNLGGLGYSRNGYNGPYELAMTMDGEIVANFITTGILQAIGIKGVSIEGSTFKIESGDFELNINPSVGINIKKNGKVTLSADPDGDIKLYGADISGGSFVTDNDVGATVIVGHQSNAVRVQMTFNPDRHSELTPNELVFENGSFRAVYDFDSVTLYHGGTAVASLINANGSGFLDIKGDAYANNWYEHSLEELKEDIQSLPENYATKLINNMDILSFKYKSDVKRGINKAKIGPVISEKYQTPVEILDPEQRAVDDHSALFLAIKALQEANKRIERLEEEITLLKEGRTDAK